MSTYPAEERDLAPSQPASPSRLGLTPLDQAAVITFAGGSGTSDLVEDARQLAEALAGPDGDAARVRLLARATAAARTQERVLEILLGEQVAKRDVEGVELINRTLDGVSRRLVALVKQLAVESSLRKRPTVFINHADEVTLNDRSEP
jgi:hypothetical protein